MRVLSKSACFVSVVCMLGMGLNNSAVAKSGNNSHGATTTTSQQTGNNNSTNAGSGKSKNVATSGAVGAAKGRRVHKPFKILQEIQ
jgi:hypothetical protein